MRKRSVRYMVGAALGVLLVPAGITAADVVPNQFIVRTSDSQALAEFAAEHRIGVEGFITYPNPSEETMQLFENWYVLTCPEVWGTTDEQLGVLQAQPWIQLTEPNVLLQLIPGWDEEVEEYSMPPPDTFSDPYTPNDPRYNDQWDKPIAETNWAWNSSTGEGVTIAIIDTGVDTTHEDLVENLVPGYNFAYNNTDISPVGGHGTSVSGMAGARMDNNLGVAGTAGKASIMMLRIADSSGAMYLNWAANAINYAADHGANVISMSFIGPAYIPMETAIGNAWDKGTFCCGGVGNSNSTDVGYPAAYEKVMAVGATTSDDERWPSSNYGEKVDIFAPGGVTTTVGGNYGGAQATSFTTPQVAGLAALVYSAYPGAAPQQVWDNIIETADTLDSDIGKILRINSRNAVFREIIIGVDEKSAEPISLKVSPIQRGAIRFAVPGAANYRLDVYDVSGSRVYRNAGRTDANGEITCNPAISQGVYFWEIRTHHGRETGKFVYVK